jgi:hypothetical protein
MFERPVTADAISDDWPTPENAKKWGLQKRENGPEWRELVLRHMSYARNRIEGILGGAQLTTIELVHLRHMAEKGLARTISYAEFAATGESFDAGLYPLEEITANFLEECMDLSWGDYLQLRRIHGDVLKEYLRRDHAKRNYDI